MDSKTTNKPSEPFLEDDMERILEPPKKWRNKFRVISDFIAIDMDNKVYKTGEIFWGLNIWPSKDIAETKHYEACERHKADDCVAQGCAEYLGAIDVTNHQE